VSRPGDPTAAAALRRLTEKWFLDPSAPVSALPPPTRHQGSLVRPFTVGNRVTPLVDGERYMRMWAEGLAMKGAHPSTHQVWHAGLALDNVGVRGRNQPGWEALERLYAAHESGVEIYGLLSDHGYYGNEENQATIDWLSRHGIYGIRRDPRYPNLAAAGKCCGSNHQKFACLRQPEDRRAVIGSADVHTGRWDTSGHQPRDPARYGKPTHEVGVLIEGPAVWDLEITFVERWNDATRTRLLPATPPLPSLSIPPAPTQGPGTQAIQVLHTYGRTSRGYSWSGPGEYTIWASYLNALHRATSYVYIEDQYFLPFDFPPRFAGDPGPGRSSDLVFQLGEAITRGVKVLVVVPSASEEPGPIPKFQKYQRDVGVAYLQKVAAVTGRPDHFTIAALSNGVEDIYVHAKVMIVDDEFVVLGSANVNQKSMTHDSEVDIAVVDADNRFVKDLRKALWAEHLAVQPSAVDNAAVGYQLMAAAARRRQRTGRTMGYDTTLSQPFGHGPAIRRIDPYAGPPR
jgi:phosphatidylserine/phosphatidylglycerophosphate/cardiolipin synthase-like enzyme